MGLESAYFKLALPALSVGPLASAINGSPPRRENLEFAGDRWSGYCVNGCRLVTGDDITLGYDYQPGRRTTNWYPCIEPIVKRIPARVVALRLFRLAPGWVVGLHRDTGEHYLRHDWTEVRKVHLPIATNGASLALERDRAGRVVAHQLAAGEPWLLDGRVLHGAANLGETDRWHLVVDVEPNADLVRLLRRVTPISPRAVGAKPVEGLI